MYTLKTLEGDYVIDIDNISDISKENNSPPIYTVAMSDGRSKFFIFEKELNRLQNFNKEYGSCLNCIYEKTLSPTIAVCRLGIGFPDKQSRYECKPCSERTYI